MEQDRRVMHLLARRCLVIASVVVVAGVVVLGGQYPAMVAAMAFLVAVVGIWFLRRRTGDKRGAWKELLKSLFLDW